jgi:hypothetical protein
MGCVLAEREGFGEEKTKLFIAIKNIAKRSFCAIFFVANTRPSIA